MSLRVRWVATAALLVLGSSYAATPAHAEPVIAAAPAISVGAGEHALIRFRLADAAALDRLVAHGADLAARPRTDAGAVLADVVVDDTQLADLVRTGAVPVQLIETESAAPARRSSLAATADTLQFLQSYWWTTNGRTFLQTEVATTAADDPDV